MASAFVRKIVADLSSMLGRLVVLGLATGIGVLVLTTITGTASTLVREMARSYEDTWPATATLELTTPVEPTAVAALVGGPVVAARTAASYTLRFLDGHGLWQPMVLFVVPDWGTNPIARVFPEPGTPWPPRRGSPAVERTAVTTFGLNPGDSLVLHLPEGRTVTTGPISVVHDPAVAPASQERTAYATVDEATAHDWGLESSHEVKLRLNPALGWAEARTQAMAVASTLQKQGLTVTAIHVPPVHAHPHQGILVTLLLILGAFGVLTVLLGSLLASNVISSLMARERRWIGVLKTIGAPPSRIVVLFLAPVVFLGLVAVSWSVPLGLEVSGGLTRTVATLLNIRVQDPAVEAWAWALPTVTGLGFPLLLALVPVRRALRLPILDSLSDVGTDRQSFVDRPVRRRALVLPPAWDLGWRNAWRKKRRLVLSLLLLGVGGGLFIGGISLSSGWKALVDEALASRHLTFQIRLLGSPTGLTGVLTDLPNGSTSEVWTSLPAVTITDGTIPVEATYPDEAHGSFRVFAVPPHTAMVSYRLQKGRWVTQPHEVVLNQTAALRFPRAEPGSILRLTAGGHQAEYRLAGVVQEVGQAAAYVAAGELDAQGSSPDFRTELLLRVAGDPAAAKPRVEAWLERRGLPVEVFLDNADYTLAGTEHFGLLITIILVTGLVTGLVGWLSVASILGLAVVERRREFGILRSLGATPGDLRASIAFEAVTMTVLGTLASLAVAYPITAGLGAFLGSLSLKMAIPGRLDAPVVVAWLALSVVAGLVASLGAAFKASRITIRETLAEQ